MDRDHNDEKPKNCIPLEMTRWDSFPPELAINPPRPSNIPIDVPSVWTGCFYPAETNWPLAVVPSMPQFANVRASGDTTTSHANEEHYETPTPTAQVSDNSYNKITPTATHSETPRTQPTPLRSNMDDFNSTFSIVISKYNKIIRDLDVNRLLHQFDSTSARNQSLTEAQTHARLPEEFIRGMTTEFANTVVRDSMSDDEATVVETWLLEAEKKEEMYEQALAKAVEAVEGVLVPAAFCGNALLDPGFASRKSSRCTCGSMAAIDDDDDSDIVDDTARESSDSTWEDMPASDGEPQKEEDTQARVCAKDIETRAARLKQDLEHVKDHVDFATLHIIGDTMWDEERQCLSEGDRHGGYILLRDEEGRIRHATLTRSQTLKMHHSLGDLESDGFDEKTAQEEMSSRLETWKRTVEFLNALNEQSKAYWDDLDDLTRSMADAASALLEDFHEDVIGLRKAHRDALDDVEKSLADMVSSAADVLATLQEETL